MNNYEKVKEHVKRNKKVYIVGGVCLGVGAGITIIIMRGRIADLQKSDGPNASIRSLKILSNDKSTNNVIAAVINKQGRGHPGYIVRCIETGELFNSQNEVADVYHCWPSIVTDHLKGKVSDISGHHFERIIIPDVG